MEIKNLKKFLLTKKNSNILVIAGKKSFYKISGDKLLKKNLSKSTKIYYYFKKSKNPEINELEIIVKRIKKLKPSLIIAIGGGCAMDYAKSANVLALEKTMNFKKKFNEKFCQLLCIPTTAGTGSETTPFSVLYVNNKKTSVTGPALKANFFYFEPKFIKYNNNYTIASAGFDSLSQSIESILSKNATQKSIRFAKKSINLVLINLFKFYKKKDEINAKNLLYAANYSGKAISISKTGVAHALSYPFSSHFNLSHGHSVSLNTLKAIEFNYLNQNKSKILKKRVEILFKCFDCKNYNEIKKKLTLIFKKLNLEQNFKKLNISKKKLIKLKKFINEDRLKNNIIKLNQKDIDTILFKR
jgi:alcohol dehydrogenase